MRKRMQENMFCDLIFQSMYFSIIESLRLCPWTVSSTRKTSWVYIPSTGGEMGVSNCMDPTCGPNRWSHLDDFSQHCGIGGHNQAPGLEKWSYNRSFSDYLWRNWPIQCPLIKIRIYMRMLFRKCYLNSAREIYNLLGRLPWIWHKRSFGWDMLLQQWRMNSSSLIPLVSRIVF